MSSFPFAKKKSNINWADEDSDDDDVGTSGGKFGDDESDDDAAARRRGGPRVPCAFKSRRTLQKSSKTVFASSKTARARRGAVLRETRRRGRDGP